jgi:long-chain acyl-CoA synthetase
VLEAGCSADDSDLDRHCNENIARFKRPKRYVYLDDLPKNAYGKVLKTELRTLLD